MEISKELLKILVCPITKQKLIYDKENLELVSPNAEVGFPIVNGIPMMLADESRPVSKDRIKKLVAEEEKRNLEMDDDNNKQEFLETKTA